MNNGQEILSRQGASINIDRLLAQRRLYTNAKIMQYVLMTFTVLVPILIALITNFSRFKINDKNWVFVIYTIVVLLGEKVIERLIDRNKKMAASIQEKFDLDVYDLEENELLNVTFIDYDIIRKYSKKDKLKSSKVRKIQNWYSLKINILQTNVAVLICQRMNICYDQNIKKKYNTLLVFLSSLTFAILFIISLSNDFSLKKFIIEVVLPVFPIFNFSYKEFNTNLESVDNLQKLREIIENKLNEVSKDDVIEQEELRKIQDRIFQNRILSPLIPNTIYNILWGKLEDEMNYSVENKINEL